MHHSQRGMGLVNLLLFGVVAFFVIITLAKLVPAYMEYFAIKRVFATMAADPELANASHADIRGSYARRSQIDNITSVTPSDLLIEQNDGRLELSASYHVEKPLFDNVGIYINFKPSTEPGTQ